MKKYGEIESFGDDIAKLFSNLEIKIMEKMIDLIKENGFSTASSDYLMNRLRSLGVAEEDVAKYFEEALKGTEIKLDKIFDDEVYKEYYGHYRDFQAVGIEQVAYKDNIELQQLVSGIHDQTYETIGGMARSLGFVLRQPNGQLIATPLQTFYQSQLDQAILEISSGAFSYEQVLEKVVNKMTTSGVRIIDFQSGAHRGMVSHVRTTTLTGFRQIQGRINEQTAQELGTEYFEISYHVGARPTHQVWQGRVFSKEELVSKCGLGSVTGLCGANCYHTYRPFIPGVSVRTYTDDELDEMIAKENEKKLYNGKEYTTYEALQQQRYLERVARKYRQDIRLLERGLEDADDAAKEILILKQARYQNTLSRYKDFTKKMGLPTQNERIFKDGLGKIKIPTKKVKKRTEVFIAKDNTSRIRLLNDSDNKDRKMLPEKNNNVKSKKFTNRRKARMAARSNNSTSSLPINKYGKEIKFSEIFEKEEWQEAKKLIIKLSKEYDTRLYEVVTGAVNAAGSVDMGGKMHLSTNKLDTVIHEFAHSLAQSNLEKYGVESYGDFWKEIKKVRSQYRRDVKDDSSRWISAYEHSEGKNKYDEFMAEAFTLAKLKQMGLKIPSNYGKDFTYADKVLEIVDRYFKKENKFKLDIQFFAKKPKDYASIRLGTREYARVVSQLNTNLTREELKPGIKTKAIGDYLYTFEVIDFDQYRFISKTRIKKTIHDK